MLPTKGDLGNATAVYTRNLREKGRLATQSYLQNFCHALPHLDRSKESAKDAKIRPTRYTTVIADFINKARAEVGLQTQSVFILNILDYTVFAGIDLSNFMDAVVASSGAICNQDTAATLVLLPVVHGEVDFQHVIKHTRTIEDQLIKCGNDLTMRRSIIFHGEDPI